MINKQVKSCAELINAVRGKNPLIHCITNYVTANTVANGLLALGASPVMADSPLDAMEITASADAVLFNMGTFGKDRCRAMLISGQEAAQSKKPIVLDPVGAGSTDYRLKNALQMLRQFRFAAVRGNPAEISALINASAVTMKTEKGVDSAAVTTERATELARVASEKFSCTVIVTGKTDVVCYKDKCALISNGVPMMSRVTGTGCLASGLVAAMCAVTDDYFTAATAAMSLIGAVGEISAKSAAGTGSFYVGIMDALTNISGEEFSGMAKIETI